MQRLFAADNSKTTQTRLEDTVCEQHTVIFFGHLEDIVHQLPVQPESVVWRSTNRSSLRDTKLPFSGITHLQVPVVKGKPKRANSSQESSHPALSPVPLGTIPAHGVDQHVLNARITAPNLTSLPDTHFCHFGRPLPVAVQRHSNF